MVPELAIIIPTLNEAGNIREVWTRLCATLRDVSFEIIFVDDNSRDATRDEISKLALEDSRVRLIHRVGRRGLSSACIEGMGASMAPLCAVMDADLQHDETQLPVMLAKLKNEQLDVVVGSRFFNDAATAQVDAGALSKRRQMVSKLGNWLAAFVTRATLTDPLSGFFLIRRDVLQPIIPRLSGKGYKILVDLFASSPKQLKAGEVGYTFRPRHAGESKLDSMVLLEYIFLLADKTFGALLPLRFVLFVLVGGVGVVVHFATLALFHRALNQSFDTAQIAALVVAMLANYVGNNWLTYRDRRLKGCAFWLGLGSFYLACSLGAFINFRISEHLHLSGLSWHFAGLVGAVIGAVWNYGVTATFTWKPKV